MEKYVRREDLSDLIGNVTGWEVHPPIPCVPVPLASVSNGAEGLVLTCGGGPALNFRAEGLEVWDVSRAFSDMPEMIIIVEHDHGAIDDMFRYTREPSRTLLATLRHEARIIANDAKEAERLRLRKEEDIRRRAEEEAEREAHLRTFDERRVAPFAAGLIGRTIVGVEVRHPRIVLALDDGSKFELEAQQVLTGGQTCALIGAGHGGKKLNTYGSIFWPRDTKKH